MIGTLWTRFLLVLLAPLLTLDCFLNVLCDGSFRHTLSGEAWRTKDHKYWGWCYRFINGLFFWQTNHCKAQAHREEIYGSAWKAYAADWRYA
jgi:hypothetical protein